MTTQWSTVIVAIVGNIGTVTGAALGVVLTGRNALRLADRNRAADRDAARDAKFEDACVQFLSAARVLRAPDGASEDREAALSELRRADAKLELYGPVPTRSSAHAARESVEKLVRVQSGHARASEVTEAQRCCDEALDAARSAFAKGLDPSSKHP